VRRLAKHLGLTVAEFERKHLVNRRGQRLIKRWDESCQFLGADRRCTVYAARPRHCREYVCWDQDDSTVYEFARHVVLPVREVKRLERIERLEREGGDGRPAPPRRPR
jgi:Fe-S-cluster containining protein